MVGYKWVISHYLKQWWLKPPLHRAATSVPPLSDQKIDQDAQWSPKPRKFCFCVTAAARPLCVPWTIENAVVAEQVMQRRQSGGRTIAMVAQGLPWSPNEGTVVATAIAQWTLLVSRMRHSGGTREAEASLKLIHNVYNSTHFFTERPMATPVHPFCDHGDACAFLLPPLSDLWATDLLGVLCATVLNMIKTSRRPLRPWQGMNVLSATLEWPRQPFGFLCAFNGDLVSFVVAQGRHKGRSPCVKGVQGMEFVISTAFSIIFTRLGFFWYAQIWPLWTSFSQVFFGEKLLQMCLLYFFLWKSKCLQSWFTFGTLNNAKKICT